MFSTPLSRIVNPIEIKLKSILKARAVRPVTTGEIV